jgi:osmotically-inducible protein OsmY
MNMNKIVKLSLLSSAVIFSGVALAENMETHADQMNQEAHQTSNKVEHEANQAKSAAQNKMDKWSAEAKEAWAQGKLETALTLNSHLSAWDIDTDVNGKTATLKGTVDSEVKKELAEEIAISIEGITAVDNELQVKEGHKVAKSENSDTSRDFGTMVSDATITASVKMNLVGSEVKARQIDVDTANGKVTLKGKVEDEATSSLAEKIAENVDGVVGVSNELTVKEEVAKR